MSRLSSPNPLRRSNERRMFSASDDSTMLKQIQATHAPDGRDVDVTPILDIVEDVFRRASLSLDAMTEGMQLEALEDNKSTEAFLDAGAMLEALAFVIQKVSCEITCKCSGGGGGDAHATTMSVLHALSNYSWDAKVVIALAALAISYGEFWLVVQLYGTHPLAKSVAALKQILDLIEHSTALKVRFDTLRNLINAMLDVSKKIVEFRLLPQHYISPDHPPLSTAITHIPTAAYWTIRSVVACATQIASLTGISFEYLTSTTEAWELSSLAHKEKNIHDHLTQQLALCHHHIDEKEHVEAYNKLCHLFETHHPDHTKILRHLIYLKDDIQPLVDGKTKSRVHVEALKRKTVLLLISDMDISLEEQLILEHIYRESRVRPDYSYEIVWLPIVDNWSDEHHLRFEELKSMMPWYTLYHPMLLEPSTVRYIKEVWHFGKKTIIVVLDPQGKVVSPNAVHMIMIWANLAFPFTDAKEEALWKDETWRVELVVDDIDPHILQSISQGKTICLYGGEDIEWIRRFTDTTKKVTTAAGIEAELVYVGKSKEPKERIKRIIETIERENLSHYWPDLTSIWYFWTRLESMLYSKMQHGGKNDHIMQEVMTVLSFDGSDQGWAIFWFGSIDMARAKGDVVLESLRRFDEWEEDARVKGFGPAFKDHLQNLQTSHHCNRLILPGIEGEIPQNVVCAECGKAMETYFMYRCCTD